MKRSHTDVLFALLDYERKMSRFFRDFFTEILTLAVGGQEQI